MKGNSQSMTRNSVNKSTKGLVAFTLTLLLLLATSLIFSTAEASTYKRVSSEVAKSNALQAEGLETFRGELIRSRDLNQVSSDTRELLKRHIIETKDGRIYYPEEVEYVLIDARPPHGSSRIPHSDERAPGN